MEKVMWRRGRGLNFAKEIASDTQKDRLKVTERTREGPGVSQASQVSDLRRYVDRPRSGWPAIRVWPEWCVWPAIHIVADLDLGISS